MMGWYHDGWGSMHDGDAVGWVLVVLMVLQLLLLTGVLAVLLADRRHHS